MSNTIVVLKDRIKHLSISHLFAPFEPLSWQTTENYTDEVIIAAIAQELAKKLVEYKKFSIVNQRYEDGTELKRVTVSLDIIVPERPGK